MSGGLVGFGGNGAAECVFGFGEIAELAVNDGGVDEWGGDAGTESSGALVFRGGFVGFFAVSVGIAEVEMLGEVVLTGVERGEIFLSDGLNRRAERFVDGSRRNSTESGSGANADEAGGGFCSFGDEIDGMGVEGVGEG